MDNFPVVSIIIPTYNRSKTIYYCLNSILKQTFKLFEVIVVDDCSTDDTIDIVTSFKDSRIRCVKLEKNMGAQAARNRGIIEAKGSWIAFQDSDDEWLPEKLEKQLQLAEQNKNDIIHCDCYIKYAYRDNYEIMKIEPYEIDTYRKILINPGPMFQGMLVKKKCLERICLLDEDVPAYQEWDTFIRLAKHYNLKFINEPLYIYHIHEGETISKDSHRAINGYSYIIEKHREEIVKVAGETILAKHYKRIANEYSNLGLNDKKNIYLNKHKIINNLIWEKLERVEGVAIFGAGPSGKQCLKKLQSKNIKVLIFIDNFLPKERMFCNIPVYRPEDLDLDILDEIDTVITASFGRAHEMKMQLEDLNIRKTIIDFVDLY